MKALGFIVAVAVVSLSGGLGLPVQAKPPGGSPAPSSAEPADQAPAKTNGSSRPREPTSSKDREDTPAEFVPSEEISADKAVSFPADI
jgi:hypothetical protein